MHWPNHKAVTEQKKPRASKKVSKGDERQSEARNHPSGQRMRATFKMSQTHKNGPNCCCWTFILASGPVTFGYKV